MTILVTGASGHLGRLIVERLLARGAAASDIVAGARSPEKAADLGVRTVHLDYEEPASIAAALEGVDRVVLVSSSEVGKRASQHAAVIDAAREAGVELLVYTSIYRGAASPLPLAPEHAATEEAIAASGVPTAILRNNWYSENYLGEIEKARETGELASSIGDGKISSASREDYADAVAAVVLGEGHAGAVYELAGDVAWGYDDLAATLGELLGREVTYRRLTGDEYRAGLQAAGLDEGTVAFVAGLDEGIAAGGLEASERTLSELIGRPTTPLKETLRAAV